MWPLLYWGIFLRYKLFLKSFVFFFNHKRVLNFVKSFFCIYWDDHMVFILQFVDVVYHTDWFADIEKCSYPWDKSHLNHKSWFVIFLTYCWIWFASVLLRIFVSIFISDVGLLFFFCVCVCDIFVRFWYQGDGGLTEWVRESSFLCNFLKKFQKDGC